MAATAAASRIAVCEDELALIGYIDDCQRRIAARSREPALLYEVHESRRSLDALRESAISRRQEMASDWKQKSEPPSDAQMSARDRS